MDIWWILGLILSAIIGALTNKYFTRDRLPMYLFKSRSMFRNGVSTIKGLCIDFNGTSIDDLTLVTLAIWNNGKSPIKSEDVVSPIRFTVPENKIILSAEPVSDPQKANKFDVQVSSDRRFAQIDFSYIDHKQGVVVEIYTNCNSMDINTSQFDYEILGCPHKIERNFSSLFYSKSRQILRIILLNLTIACLSIGVFTLITSELLYSQIFIMSSLLLAISAFVVTFYNRFNRYRGALPGRFSRYFADVK